MSVAGNAGGASNATVRQFLEIIKSVKLLSPEDFAAVVARWPEARWGEDAGNLAKELVQQGKLTRFQAAAAYQCKPRGLVIGPYLILDRLGAGGMGTVFKGEHREKKTIVAIKVLASSAVRSADSVERFYREARTAARLDHPGIVRALDIGEGDGQHYYVMEYVEGVDLSAYIKKQGPLPLDQAVQVVAQAARALAHAHEHGVIHRDIKPGNLIYTKDGKIKILDMGLARLNDPATLATSQAAEGLTQTGQVMGTVDYMAPEQAVNTRLADARADVYSLGCTLYRLATGKIPFDGESMVEKILAHREQPVPSLGSGTTPVPPAVDHVLRKMLAKKPDDRYQTMNELADDLDKCLSGDLPSGPIVARPLALAAVEAESSSSVTFNLGGTPVPGSINKRHKKGSGLVYAAVAAALIMVVGAGSYYAMELSKVKPTVVADDTETPPPTGVGDVTDKTSSDSKQPADKTDATSKPNVSVNVETKPNPPGMTPPGPMPVTPAQPTGPDLTSPPRAFGAPPPTTTPPGSTTPTGTMPQQPATGQMPNNPAPFAVSPAAPLPATPMPTPMPVPLAPTPAPTTAPPTVAIEAMIPTEVADTRKELPDQAAIDASIKLIRTDVFKDEYAKAKKSDERVALARKLYDHATQVKDPNADQFAMLSEARDLASEGGDLTLIDTSAALVGANFKVETLEWIVTGIEAAQKKTLSAAINKQIAGGLLTKVDEAVRDDKYEVASRLMKATLASARKASDPTGLKTVVDRGKQLDEETKQWELVEKARKTLADKPDDPAANLTLGKYLCFTENDWEKGPAHLAKGSDAALKELGEKSLKAPDKPDDLVVIGDLWWARADKANGAAKKEFQFGALYWYEKSLDGLEGLNKTKVDKRIADAKQAVAGMGTAGRATGKTGNAPNPLVGPKTVPGKSLTKGQLATRTPQTSQVLCDWVWQRNGGVTGRYTTNNSSGTRTVYRAADIPENFEISGIRFSTSISSSQSGPARISDSELMFISEIPWITSVTLYNQAVTNVGIAAVSSLPNLEMLTITQCRQFSDIGLAPLAKNTTLRALSLSDVNVTGALTSYLVNNRSLNSLYLTECPLVDADLAPIEKLASVSTLSFSGSSISDRALVYVRGVLTGYLDVSMTKISDAGLATISNNTSISSLHLNGTNITGRGLAALERMRQLNSLYLDNCKITDVEASIFARFTQLSYLALSNTAITDNTIAKLAGHPTLSSLQIYSCNVSDACVPFLAKMPRLRYVYASRTRMTQNGAAAVTSALPNCKVYCN